MPLWRLVPHADPDDARWLDHPIWEEVVVRADSAAQARLYAGRLEENRTAPPAGNECPSGKSGFADEKLYWVRELGAADALAYADAPGPVIAAALARPGR